MPKIFILSCCFFSNMLGWSQVVVSGTDSFVVESNINRTVFSLANVSAYHVEALGNIASLNHAGQVLNVRSKVKGILLKNVLTKVALPTSKPKELFKYYLVLEATDGFKVVLSRNEVFTTNNFYIITQSNGQSWQQSKDRIEILDLYEKGKGHIYIKGLSKIRIKSID